MHDSRTWRQRTGVKTLSHTPTLLACFIIRASFETVKVLVTHGRTQKTHGENIITETLTAVPNTLTQQRRCYHATGHLQQTDNRPIWRHRHVNVSTKHADTTAVQHRQYHGNTAVIPRSFKMNNVEYICTKCFENFATEDEYIPLGEQSPCRLRDGNAISVEWISSSALNALSIALLSTPTL